MVAVLGAISLFFHEQTDPWASAHWLAEPDIPYPTGVFEEEGNMKVVLKKPTLVDVSIIEALLGEFPAQNIESLLTEHGINIRAEDVPRSFSKYFSVMKAISGDLRGKTLLDFGCGLGVFVSQASRLGMRAEGLDIFTEYGGRCLEAAQYVISCISVTPPRLTQLDFVAEDVNREADFVTSFGMLEHIHGAGARNLVMKKMMQALRPGGHLILTCGPNRRFPFDLHHYGPKFLFYHCLPIKLRDAYLQFFAKTCQNMDPRWLNGMSVSEIKQSIVSHGGEAVEQVLPLWIELAKTRYLKSTVIRRLAVSFANLLTRMQAEPVIILVAKKKVQE